MGQDVVTLLVYLFSFDIQLCELGKAASSCNYDTMGAKDCVLTPAWTLGAEDCVLTPAWAI